MAVQKNFIIRNGLEVNNNLLVADTASDRVGIGTSNPKSTFEVIGGIGATNINILGISTVLTEFNVGSGGTVITSLNTGLTGFGTVTPAYIVDIRSPVSTGQTALYVQGDVRFTGDLYADDISFDQATVSSLEVTGIGTIANFKATNVNVSGVTTTNTLAVNTGFDVYATDSTFHGSVTIDGNLSIGGTSAILNAVQVRVEDKDIVLGFTTTVTPSDDTANHGGIAIASTEGYPLISMSASGINTLPDTYKQIMWLKRDTMGAGTTDVFLFNYAVGVGSTQVPNGVRFAVSGIQFTDNTINTTNLNATGVGTITTASVNLGYVNTGIVTTLSGSNLSYTGIGSFGSINADTGRVTTGIITTLSGSNLNYSGISTLGILQVSSGIVTATSGVVTYYGDGSKLTGVISGVGINTAGGVVGTGATILDFRGAGISTVTVSAGIATINITSGGGGGASVGIGSTFPASSSNGNLFYHIDYGRTFVYYDEVALGVGLTAVWIDASPFNIGILTLTNLTVTNSLTATNINSSGVVTASSFVGNGSSLTALNATQLTTGTIPGDRGVTAGSSTVSFVKYNGTTATAGQFDGGTTNPTGTTRLNYSGYLYATRFYGDGSNLNSIPNSATTATSTNTASAIVARDASGNFSAGTITASLSGTANNATTASTANALNTSNTYQVSRIGVGQAAGTGTAIDVSGCYAQTVVSVAALDIDCSLGNYFTKTISANSTFTFSNVPSSRAFSFTLELTHTSGTVTWPASVKWPADTAPTLTTGKTHLFIFVTDDGGSRWRGASLVDYVN